MTLPPLSAWAGLARGSQTPRPGGLWRQTSSELQPSHQSPESRPGACHASARLDTKQSLIGGMVSGTTVYAAVEPPDVKAQDFDDTVVLTGSARIRVTANGNPIHFGVRFTDVYVNKGGQWQMVAWQSIRLPE